MSDTGSSRQSGLDAVIKKAGGQIKVASRVGVSQQVIAFWKKRGYVPVNRAVELESIYGVSRVELISPRLRELFEGLNVGVFND